MSLERYVENAWLRHEPSSPQEIADQIGIVERSMKDAGVQDISDDLRFYTTFNAVLALANIALRASGYRTTSQTGHHTRILETLEYTIGADSKLIRKLITFSKKRNSASYDSAGSISNHELEQILLTAETLRQNCDGVALREPPRASWTPQSTSVTCESRYLRLRSCRPRTCTQMTRWRFAFRFSAKRLSRPSESEDEPGCSAIACQAQWRAIMPGYVLPNRNAIGTKL